MEPNPEIYVRMLAIDWFSRCGNEPPSNLPFQFRRALDSTTAIATARASSWQDAGTAAQGELTSYLARTDYDLYGTSWNWLGDVIENHIKKEIMPSVTEALSRIGTEAISGPVLLDLTRIGLWSTYKKRFRRAPDFFQKLLVVYECGHLPCGWIGNLDLWPEGQLIVY
jgi:hypothetical protein